MGEEFYGLAKAVDTALEMVGPQKEVAAVLKRNIQPDQDKAMLLADHIIKLSERVDQLPEKDILSGPEAI